MMKGICVYIIKFYQKFISPLKGSSCCRFNPTCSHYALTAYEIHGFFGGTFLTVKRILRCNPFFKGGNDPVPQKITIISKKTTETNSQNGEL